MFCIMTLASEVPSTRPLKDSRPNLLPSGPTVTSVSEGMVLMGAGMGTSRNWEI